MVRYYSAAVIEGEWDDGVVVVVIAFNDGRSRVSCGCRAKAKRHEMQTTKKLVRLPQPGVACWAQGRKIKDQKSKMTDDG